MTLPQPTTAGTPISRAMIAAWQVRPPRLVTIAAAFRQTEMIERLRDSGKLSLLPPELEETAKARLAHREMNLTSLASTFTPPISKSGLAHRLERIVRLAETLLEET